MAEVSNRDLYEAIGELRGEFTGAIQRLDDKFMQLEAGRLTRAEGNISSLQLDLQKSINRFNASIDKNKEASNLLSGKLIIVGIIATAILYGLVNALAVRFIGK